ncbi:MAG: hypothetical protein AAGA77_17450 [Bacteroidota bacterium]
MHDQKIYEKIEAYLNGNLSASELNDFEEQLRTDEELAEQVVLFKDIHFVIEDEDTLKFQHIVENSEKDYFESSNANTHSNLDSNKIRRNLKWFIVMAVIVFLSVLIWNRIQHPAPSNQELFALYFEPFVINDDLRGPTKDENQFIKAIDLYQEGRFDQASAMFNTLTEQDHSNMIYAFYLANSTLNQTPRDFDLAKKQYEKIITEGKSIYVSDSKWYLSLIALVQGNKNLARSILLELQKQGHHKNGKVQNLLDQLKE